MNRSQWIKYKGWKVLRNFLVENLMFLKNFIAHIENVFTFTINKKTVSMTCFSKFQVFLLLNYSLNYLHKVIQLSKYPRGVERGYKPYTLWSSQLAFASWIRYTVIGLVEKCMKSLKHGNCVISKVTSETSIFWFSEHHDPGSIIQLILG